MKLKDLKKELSQYDEDIEIFVGYSAWSMGIHYGPVIRVGFEGQNGKVLYILGGHTREEIENAIVGE